MPTDELPRSTETCPGCGAVLVPLTEAGPSHPGASISCARLFEVTIGGLREEAPTSPATAAVVALADATYDAQHPVPADDVRLQAALDHLDVSPGTHADGMADRMANRMPDAWRTTIADVAADLDVIDLTVLVQSWARAVREDWRAGLTTRDNGTNSAPTRH